MQKKARMKTMQNEYIDKGALYDALWDAKEEKQVKSLKGVFDFIDKFPVEDVQEVKWISVKDRLPDKEDEYLCISEDFIYIFEFAKDLYKVDKYSFDNRKGKSGFYEFDREWGYYEKERVTHWMPLPELPKGEQQ